MGHRYDFGQQGREKEVPECERRAWRSEEKSSEQNKTFTRASSESGCCLSEDEIRAEAQKRQKEMRGAARAVEMTEEEVAHEKLKGLAEKEAARKAATGQAGKVKPVSEEAKRWAATGQADKDKHAAVEAARKATTG